MPARKQTESLDHCRWSYCKEVAKKESDHRVPYCLRHFDGVIWAVRMLSMIKHQGILAFPTTRLVYQVDHVAKTLTLLDPFLLYDDTDGGYAAVVHRRTIRVFREVGYQVMVKEK